MCRRCLLVWRRARSAAEGRGADRRHWPYDAIGAACCPQTELLLSQGHTDAAEELYCKALSIAEEQGARLLELRAAMIVALLRYEQGRHTEARDLLMPVYGWFTEGFDTTDLKGAKASLEELT